ncbi:hypothetical protein [Pseudoduganella armeniaca]|uniref:Uncharacterized protein n=1 Tax=Pseudoduganella armeniaca TaxID=2072590 RepID=A0A2R4CBV9_9BURK|nr:hypothetical protein [Pseudoduganella armeniaca]AVR97124.1 hypothetical protein C9I28_16845 [Pseudoduganella armeniaca]
MNGYRELFRLCLEHAYHGGAWRGWEIEPVGVTRRLMDGAGVLVRRSGADVVFLAPAERMHQLRREQDAAAQFVLLVHAHDPLFASYTQPVLPAGQLLVADSAQAGDDGVLPAGASPADAPLCRLALDQAASQRRPALVLRIELDTAAPERRFVVRFEAGSSFWKYYVTGGLAARPLAIADLDGIVAFRAGAADQERPAGALVFLSDRPIALRARPGERFVLKENGPFGERVLMKRMPVAGTGLRQRAVLDGQVVQVSEIFINQ